MSEARLYTKYEIEHFFECLPDDAHMEFQNDFFKGFMQRRVQRRDCSRKDIIDGYGTWWRMWTHKPTREQASAVPFDPNIPVNRAFNLMMEEKLIGVIV